MVLDHDLVLKSDELYLVGDSQSDGSGEAATGLYLRDTRFLSRFRLSLDGEPLERLSARVLNPARAAVTETNVPRAGADPPGPPPHSIAVEQHVELDDAVRVRFALRNHGVAPMAATFAIEVAADFRDLFDIRGFPRARRGDLRSPRARPDGVTLAYVGLDGLRAETEIAFDREAAIAVIGGDEGAVAEQAVLLPALDGVAPRQRPPIPPGAVASFAIDLPPGADWSLSVTITPRPASGAPISVRPTLADGAPLRQATVTTDNAAFDRFLARCDSDLASLQTSFPEGSLPAAGIPWFVAPFGRDSLIVGLQTFHAAPERAATTLRVLAALQGTEIDEERDEEPGKILHEMRYGEMARRREVPHTPYFGSVDSTPLFVLLFAETVAWSGDERLYGDLLPHVRRALDWIERFGDVDGDGLVEYRAVPGRSGHILHQGWKDSHDSLHHPDGRPATGRIALVEVQGYVYAAYRRLAAVVAERGDAAWAAALGQRADRIGREVEVAYWMPGEGYYAQALDGDKAAVLAVSSNPGHLLFCGLPSPERAAAVAARIGRPDLDSGWGVRTLSAGMTTYNPMSYHNGSVWPHDNALMAAGLRRYGYHRQADRIAAALAAAAAADPQTRLPELYCGFPRAAEEAGDAPVGYPVSCSPQAWASGVGPHLTRSMLGLHFDEAAARLVVSPSFPPWIGTLAIDQLVVRGERVRVGVRREGAGYAVEASDGVEIAVGPPSETPGELAL
ncbi:MAG: Glycogen debranching enzyme (Alpha-1,6-glucosidase) [uncultured Thermomicrobiales bacterium]|uniref:Glycogen debranching enzyme (Alpha-1,6-glucosidase) n=1 Tax=uncultured Thermomicrobiales bacterium TaxID=1645740 RepID=A0A6J4VST6_9BACT|nr:MAG: Glycogen debranching enzyme (Alpha-1,6-glucosidase) [uncultured Thermomicrobiales bacterium]